MSASAGDVATTEARQRIARTSVVDRSVLVQEAKECVSGAIIIYSLGSDASFD